MANGHGAVRATGRHEANPAGGVGGCVGNVGAVEGWQPGDFPGNIGTVRVAVGGLIRGPFVIGRRGSGVATVPRRSGIVQANYHVLSDASGVFHPLGVTFFWALYGWKFELAAGDRAFGVVRGQRI